MADLKIFSPDGLVDATVKQRQETYFLVTEDNLSSLKNKSLLADIFLFLSSLTWGAYASTTITINSIPILKDDKDVLINILFQLKTLQKVFIIAAIVFTLLTIWLFYQSYDQIKKIKSGGQFNVGKAKESA